MATKKHIPKNNTYENHYALLAAVLTVPAVLLVYFFADRLPGRENIFLNYDLRVQYIAFAKLFWNSLLKGEGIDYTFHLSLGMPSVPLYTFYSLSPFNLLYLFIDHVELASIYLVVLKLSLSAYTFQRFAAKVLKNNTISSAAFAVGYSLCGYSLIYYYNILYLDGIYMLPVIAMLIVEAVKERRYTKLTLAYAYLFLVQFYEGYIIGFFSLLFFILLMVAEYKKECKKYIAATVRLGISVGIAALIGAAFLYPTAVYLFSNKNELDIAAWILDCHIWDIYKNMFMGQFQTNESPYPYVYCGVMVLYLVPCYFADQKVRKEHKVIALALLGYLILCSVWLPGYRFMHCFDYPNGFGFRFAYFYAFALLAIGCVELKNMNTKRARILFLLFLFHTIGYFIMNGSEESVTLTDKVSNVIFLSIFLIFFILYNKYYEKQFYQWIFLGMVLIELVVDGGLIGGKFEQPQLLQRAVYRELTDMNQRAVDEIKAYDQGFYRIGQENPYDPNDSSMNDYYGILYFSTLENITYRETMGALGYAASQGGVHDNGGTPLTKMLFAQKYEITVNGADYMLGRSDAVWVTHERSLSLGYMVSDAILDTSTDNDNVFENLNNVAGDMIGQDFQVFVPYSEEITGITDHMSVLWNGQYYILTPEEENGEGSLTFRLGANPSMPVYAYFSQDESNYLVSSYYFASREDDQMRIRNTNLLAFPQIIELAEDDEGRYFVGIYCDSFHSYNGFYKESYFYYYDESALDRVYEVLKDHQMNILEMKGSDITAEIDVPADKHILFTSIPYDRGWHIDVDGKEAETLAVVNDTFLAVELEEGHHELKFYYSSDVNRLGAGLSAVGIVLFIGMMLLEKRNVIKDQKNIQKGKVEADAE